MHVNFSFLLFVFGINVLYLTVNTMRLLLQNRGLLIPASLFGMVEITLYTLGLNYVLKNLNQPVYLLAYAIGFGIGIFTGMLIDRWLAIGYVIVQVITAHTLEEGAKHSVLSQLLRDQGYGVTEMDGEGRDGTREVLEVLVPRRDEKAVYRTVQAYNPNAFMISITPTGFNGGFWTKHARGRKKKS
ncbi:DUF2179 domain-containing protein [Agrilactobacillus fermenti]|uniref:DUF2179 domain-containing protein n=1 Tax=Agrilactobacillus fermenti TaxID=2586909 RepID=UPI001E393C40|nr:DUF2179 domain-containing protein [Agrilactobacillus fermenti]MCD2256966.1 DUF2179 domain-containing protein [Agrilactobacillus fermenti]